MKIIKTMFILLVLMSFFILSKVNALSLYSGTIGTNQITGQDRAYNGFFMKDNLALNTDWTINYTLTNINISNYDYLIMHLYFNYYDDVTYGTTTNEYQPVENTQYYCSSWSQRQQTYADGTQSNYYVCEIWSPSGQSGTYQTSSITEALYNNKIQIQADLLMDDNYWAVCTIENDSNGVSTLTCPLNNNRTKINRIRVRYTSLHWGESAQTRASVGLSNVYNLYRDPVRDLITQENNNTQSIINNQTENQQQSHQDMQNINNSINNNNVSGANNDANSFVSNQAFQDNTGLSSVITAPLSVVNSLTATCSPIRLTLPYIDTDIDIPCIGTLLEQKVGALAQLIKVVVNGFICYIIGLDLFKIVKHARDPNDDRIEVLDL